MRRGEAWLCAACGSLLPGAGGFFLSPCQIRCHCPQNKARMASRVKPPNWADGKSPIFFCFPWRDDPGHPSCLCAPLFIGWTVTRWLQQPVQVLPASQGFPGACFCTLVLVHPQSLGWIQVAPSHFSVPAPKWCLLHRKTRGDASICRSSESREAKAPWLYQQQYWVLGSQFKEEEATK